MIFKGRKNKSGFTLVEFLFYIALFSIFFTGLFTLLQIFYDNRADNNIRLEVEKNGLIISQIISQEIRNAQSINHPLSGQSDSFISLETYDSLRNPIVISLNDNLILYSEGNSFSDNLSTQRVSVSDLVFENQSDNNVNIVNFSFLVSYRDYSKEFFSSVNLNLINDL